MAWQGFAAASIIGRQWVCYGHAETATGFLKRHYGIFEAALNSGPYFLGSRFSILDIYVWMIVQWWGDYDTMRRDCWSMY